VLENESAFSSVQRPTHALDSHISGRTFHAGLSREHLALACSFKVAVTASRPAGIEFGEVEELLTELTSALSGIIAACDFGVGVVTTITTKMPTKKATKGAPFSEVLTGKEVDEKTPL